MIGGSAFVLVAHNTSSRPAKYLLLRNPANPLGLPLAHFRLYSISFDFLEVSPHGLQCILIAKVIGTLTFLILRGLLRYGGMCDRGWACMIKVSKVKALSQTEGKSTRRRQRRGLILPTVITALVLSLRVHKNYIS